MDRHGGNDTCTEYTVLLRALPLVATPRATTPYIHTRHTTTTYPESKTMNPDTIEPPRRCPEIRALDTFVNRITVVPELVGPVKKRDCMELIGERGPWVQS